MDTNKLTPARRKKLCILDRIPKNYTVSYPRYLRLFL